MTLADIKKRFCKVHLTLCMKVLDSSLGVSVGEVLFPDFPDIIEATKIRK